MNVHELIRSSEVGPWCIEVKCICGWSEFVEVAPQGPRQELTDVPTVAAHLFDSHRQYFGDRI